MRVDNCNGVYEPEDDSFLLMGIEEIKGSLIEIGCGTGIVGLSYAENGVNVTLVDISRQAVKCARNNASKIGVDVKVIRTDLFRGIRGKFDYCIFNPPYLPEDPPNDGSWTGGKEGNETTIAFLDTFMENSDIAFYIESSLSPVPRGMFEHLKFDVVNRINYDLEELELVRVSRDAFHR